MWDSYVHWVESKQNDKDLTKKPFQEKCWAHAIKSDLKGVRTLLEPKNI